MVHRFLSVVFFLFVAFFFHSHFIYVSLRIGFMIESVASDKRGIVFFSASFFFIFFSPIKPCIPLIYQYHVDCREVRWFFCVIPFSSSGQWSTKKHFVLHGYQIKLTITYLLLKQIPIHNQTNKNLQFNVG